VAISRGLGKFAARFAVVSGIIFGNASKRVRAAALAADRVVVFATPVRFGRARANWIVSLGSPSQAPGNRAPGSNPAQVAISQGEQTIAQWEPAKGSIFISNGVPYIQELEHGSSAQAPNGMTAQAIQAAQAELRRGGLLRGL